MPTLRLPAPALMVPFLFAFFVVARTAPAASDDARGGASATAPFKYLDATAYHVLPETHNNESGYFSLCAGLDGNVYVGAAKYGENAYLIEFDRQTFAQRVVVDVNKVCGLSAKGYAAQAKLHTRNFVGPRTGIVYAGSKQGYRLGKDDTADYSGGYVVAYDPRTGAATNLGMPYEKQGVIDVVADEGRDLLYVVTCEDQHWMLGSAAKGGPYREIGPMLTPYATTLLAADGRAYAITKDFELARYDPATKTVATRPIEVGGKRWARPDASAIPTWQLAPDRKSAYLILMNDPTLIQIPLDDGAGQGGGAAPRGGAAGPVVATRFGKLIDGKNPDSRCGLDVGPDGRVYTVVRVDNQTGFGTGYLHHVLRFDPASRKTEDLGVLRVKNPDYFDFEKGPDGQKPHHSHGFHRLPDGSLTPLHAHMALMAGRDGSVYVTVIYPFTLLKVDAAQIGNTAPRELRGSAPGRSGSGAPRVAEDPGRSPWAPDRNTPAARELDAALASVDRTEALLPEISRAAEMIADRHLRGGLIGLPLAEQAIAQELWGRSGNIMHVGFDRGWKAKRTPDEEKLDVAIVGYDRPAGANDAAALTKLKDRGVWVVGIGPASLRQPACDVWLDPAAEPGLRSTVANAVVGWALMAETVAACTRNGKMPAIWKSWAYDDGKAWSEPLFQKVPFHTYLTVPPVPPGELGRTFLRQIRYPLRRLDVGRLRAAANLITDEIKAGRKTTVAWQGHMPTCYVGKLGTEAWAVAAELHPFLDSQIESYRKRTPDVGLVLSLGYHGLDPKGAAVWKEKRQRVIHLTGDHPDPAWQGRDGLLDWIDLGYAFGDACVTVEGYPIRLFAPSGVAQAAAFAAVDAEVRAR